MFDRTLFNTLARRSEGALVRTPPVVPLPVLNDHTPVLLVFDHTDNAIELAYERHPQPGGTLARSTTRETTLYYVPRLTPVFGVSAGFVVYARRHVDGHTIVIDHRNGWATVYSRLEHMFVMPTDRVARRETKIAAGDILGYLGATRAGPLKPLRFELWKCGRDGDYEPVDPIRFIRQWRYVGWNDARLEKAATPRVA